MRGRIVALSCGVYSVLSDGVIYKVSARGVFRSRHIKPVVGDLVELDDTYFVINYVDDRKNYLIRPPIANIDQMLIVESLIEPEFSYLLAFKYLTYANMYQIEAKIVLTKSDSFKDENKLEEIVSLFKKMNIETFVVSNKDKTGLDEVKSLFKNKVTCLIGQTGVGKSSLINAINPAFEREIGEYSKALNRGKHQTKEVVLLPYEGGFIADTPGFSSLDLNLYKEDLAKYYPGFDKLSLDCYFSDCLHISEGKCCVKMKLENHEYPQIAYDCYLKLSNEAIFKAERYK